MIFNPVHSPIDPPASCQPCAERGKPNVAAVKVVSGTAMCLSCFGGLPIKERVPARKVKLIQADRQAGMTFEAIAVKYGISISSAHRLARLNSLPKNRRSFEERSAPRTVVHLNENFEFLGTDPPSIQLTPALVDVLWSGLSAEQRLRIMVRGIGELKGELGKESGL